VALMITVLARLFSGADLSQRPQGVEEE
jgi:hypothetical protein